MKQLAITAIIVTLILHNIASANTDDTDSLASSIEPAFIDTESADNDGYKIPLEGLLESGGSVIWLLDMTKGRDAARAQTVAHNVLMAQEAGKEYLEDLATIELLHMLLEKYPANKPEETSGTKRLRVTHTRRVVTSKPASRGFKAVGIRHSNHAKQQKPREDQTAPTAHNDVYKISDLSSIGTMRVQIAEKHGEKVADTMISIDAYRVAIEESAKEGQCTIALQGDRIIGGNLKLVVFKEEVYFRVSALPKGTYQAADFGKINDIREQVARDYDEKVAETIAQASAYKSGIEKAIREKKTAITIQGNSITGGYLLFTISEGKTQYGIVQYEKSK